MILLWYLFIRKEIQYLILLFDCICVYKEMNINKSCAVFIIFCNTEHETMTMQFQIYYLSSLFIAAPKGVQGIDLIYNDF